MRLLTRMPGSFLLLSFLVSQAVRNAVTSPTGIVAVVVGICFNRWGALWLRHIMSAASTDPTAARRAERVCAAIAAHLRAGGSIESALAVLAPLDDACASAARVLADGEPLNRALTPLDTICPQLRRTLLAAHRDGLPLAPAMESLVTDIATNAARDARARLARVPVRSTAPLVMCVLPSFLLVAVTPVALAALGGLTHTSAA
jgi:tight adherence protein B